MTTRDLVARGFTEFSRLPPPFTFCTVCQASRWFVWWQQMSINVCACRECGTVPTSDEKWVQRFKVRKEWAA